MHFRGEDGCGELELSKRVMTGPLPPSTSKHDPIYKQWRPPRLSCASVCGRFCITLGQGQEKGEVPRTEPGPAAVQALQGSSQTGKAHKQQETVPKRELTGSKRTKSADVENIRAVAASDFRSHCCSAFCLQLQCFTEVNWKFIYLFICVCDLEALGGFWWFVTCTS